MIRHGLSGSIDELFSLENYDVFVNGIKSESKKEEMQNDLDIARLILILIITIFSYVTSSLIILVSTITLLIQIFRYKRMDYAGGNELLKSVGFTWLGALGCYVLLTIAINVLW